MSWKVLPPRTGASHGPMYFEFLRDTLVMLAWAGLYLGYAYERQLRAVQLDRAHLDASAKDRIRVSNPGMLNPSVSGAGTGLANTRERLRQVLTLYTTPDNSFYVSSIVVRV
jgi:hypothetical protein